MYKFSMKMVFTVKCDINESQKSLKELDINQDLIRITVPYKGNNRGWKIQSFSNSNSYGLLFFSNSPKLRKCDRLALIIYIDKECTNNRFQTCKM